VHFPHRRHQPRFQRFPVLETILRASVDRVGDFFFRLRDGGVQDFRRETFLLTRRLGVYEFDHSFITTSITKGRTIIVASSSSSSVRRGRAERGESDAFRDAGVVHRVHISMCVMVYGNKLYARAF